VLQLALVLPPAAPAGTVRMVTVENTGRVNLRKWFRKPGPCDDLLRSDKVDVREGEDGVQEVEESLLAMVAVEEPGCVEEEGEGGLGLGVVLQEVLGEDLLDFISLLLVEATISHGT